MVSVSIPVAACVLFCGNTVDNKVAAVIAVKPPDDVEQSCFARTARAQNRNKLIAAEFKAHAAQCVLNKIAGFILFGNFFLFQALFVASGQKFADRIPSIRLHTV